MPGLPRPWELCPEEMLAEARAERKAAEDDPYPVHFTIRAIGLDGYVQEFGIIGDLEWTASAEFADLQKELVGTSALHAGLLHEVSSTRGPQYRSIFFWY